MNPYSTRTVGACDSPRVVWQVAQVAMVDPQAQTHSPCVRAFQSVPGRFQAASHTEMHTTAATCVRQSSRTRPRASHETPACGRHVEVSPRYCHVRMSPHGRGDDRTRPADVKSAGLFLALKRGVSPARLRGADEGTRTPDLRITSALLCQLSYVGIYAPGSSPWRCHPCSAKIAVCASGAPANRLLPGAAHPGL